MTIRVGFAFGGSKHIKLSSGQQHARATPLPPIEDWLTESVSNLQSPALNQAQALPPSDSSSGHPVTSLALQATVTEPCYN